jgi:hypothetical protein
VGKRDSTDQEWQDLKKRIKTRDKNMCRGLRCLSSGEYKKFIESSPGNINTIDPAHIFPVSAYPDMCYNDKNVLSICRGIHTRLDNFKDLITGNSCGINETYYWWLRCIKMDIIKYEEELDYKQICFDLIL